MNRKYKATNGTFSYYKAEVMTAQDYYPFGMTEPQRGFEAETQTCHYDTIHTTKYALNDTFSLSWDLLNSGWSSIGTSVVSFLTNEDMKITQAVPITLTTPLTFGAKKSFVSGVGVHTVSFSLKENTCQYITYTNIIIPHNNVSPTTVNIKNSQGTIVATQNYTSAGFYSFPFSTASAGNYTIEFTTKTNYACRIEVDDVKISYDSVHVDTVCSGGARANNYRFGYNTQLKDDEIYGKNNAYSVQFWEYDPRVVKRWNTDPKYDAPISPYVINFDSPIWFSDVNGDKGDNSSKHVNNMYKIQTKINKADNRWKTGFVGNDGAKITQHTYNEYEANEAKYQENPNDPNAASKHKVFENFEKRRIHTLSVEPKDNETQSYENIVLAYSKPMTSTETRMTNNGDKEWTVDYKYLGEYSTFGVSQRGKTESFVGKDKREGNTTFKVKSSEEIKFSLSRNQPEWGLKKTPTKDDYIENKEYNQSRGVSVIYSFEYMIKFKK